MQKPPYPNKLKTLVKEAGLTMREVHRETTIPEGTLRWWASGNGVIPKDGRVILAQVIGCEVQDLAPLYNAQRTTPKKAESEPGMKDEKKSFLPMASDGLFQIGKRRGIWLPLDGDGTVAYRLENITTHYLSAAEELPEEFQKRKERVAQEQQERKAQGLPFAWNGDIYNLTRFVMGREPIHEEMTLDLWFRPGDYYTFLATNKSLDDPAIRAKYFAKPNWYEPIPFFSNSFGIALVVVTKDNYCLLTLRSPYQAIHANIYSAASVVESLSRPVDKRTDSFAPDLCRCACRGLSEELGLIEQVDFSPKDIVFLNFGVNTVNALWALRGMIRVQRTCQEILDKWSKGVKDKLENQKLHPLPFTPEDYVQFIIEHEMIGESLYYAHVHEFGRERVEMALSRLEEF